MGGVSKVGRPVDELGQRAGVGSVDSLGQWKGWGQSKWAGTVGDGEALATPSLAPAHPSLSSPATAESMRPLTPTTTPSAPQQLTVSEPW